MQRKEWIHTKEKKERAMLVGLCGRSGSGKGYVSTLFSEIGIPSIDTDAVYRGMTSPAETLSPCMQELVDRFGKGILNPDNALDRGAMRALVFGDNRQALADLNCITHKHILKETLTIANELSGDGYDIVLIDAPLLFESGFHEMCACSICVTAPESTVLRRIMRRDGISEDDARRRLATQKSVDELIKKSDFQIVNDCEREILLERVRDVAERIRKIYHTKNRNCT